MLYQPVTELCVLSIVSNVSALLLCHNDIVLISENDWIRNSLPSDF